MTAPAPTAPDMAAEIGTFRDRARRRPLATFLLLAFGIGWPSLAAPAITGLPGEPFLAIFLYGALLAPALIVTRWADGPGAVRRLLTRTLQWRFGLARWAVTLFGVPALTLAIAGASGTSQVPEQGWLHEAGMYLLGTLVIGALLGNIWEETAWGGFVQSRLMERHGLLVGSLLTAPLFAAIHVPLEFYGDRTWSGHAVQLLILLAIAVVYRYLIGTQLLDTGGSLLAIGVLHASWNASRNLDAVEGEWQVGAAVVLLTLLVAVARRRSPAPLGRYSPRGRTEIG